MVSNPNSLNQEEHDFGSNSKKVFMVGSNATIFAVVNTSAGGGTTTVTPVGLTTLAPSPNYIGLATVIPASAWPDPKGYIGLVTITGSLSPAAGNVTLDPGSKTGIVGNVTLSDPKGFIGLTTSVNGQAWPDPKTFIGLVTVVGSLSPAAGNVTLDPGSKTGIVGNVTISDSKGFIGLVTIGGMSLVTLGDPKGYIGLVTSTPVGLSSNYTSLASVVSASGLATILIPPSGKIANIKDLFVTSLGRSEVSFWVVNSSATGLRMPWTALATTGGYIGNFGDSGLNVGKADDGLTINLNGAATVSWMANVKFI